MYPRVFNDQLRPGLFRRRIARGTSKCVDPFWKANNRRIGKILDTSGPFDEWRVVDEYIDIEGLPDPREVAETVGSRLQSTMLGSVSECGTNVVRIATSAGTRGGYARRLIIDELRRLKVPASVLVRYGFPEPYAATRVYPNGRVTNLEVLGKPRRRKPVTGDTFAYSFDRERFHWGQVVQDDLDYMGATTLVIFFASCTKSLEKLPETATDQLLLAPLAIDAGAWRRGHFLTVANLVPRTGDFEWAGWTPSSNLDITLSIANGVPCVAPP